MYDGMTDEMHISVNERGKIRTVLTKNMSALGIRLGGANRLFTVLAIYAFLAIPVVIGSVLWLGSSNYDLHAKSIIGSAILGGYFLLFPLIVMLYCRLRVTLQILGILLVLGLFAALPHLIGLIVWH